jgi:hypothetical protein
VIIFVEKGLMRADKRIVNLKLLTKGIKMRKLYFFIMFLLLIPCFSFASPESELQTWTSNVPTIEPAYPPMPTEPFAIPEPPAPGTQVTPDALSQLSGVLYYSYSKDWGLLPSNPPSPLEQTSPSAEQLAPALSISGAYNMTSDSYQDAEPSVMAFNSNGTIYKATTYIKILPNGSSFKPLIYYSSTPNFSTFYRGQLALPSGYQFSGDPLMSKNPYNVGIAPGRIYTTGTIYNPSQSGYGIPNGIAVWYSDDGGRSWYGLNHDSTQPTIVISNLNDSTSIYDKPAIDVSRYAGSLGYVYVAGVYVTSSGTYIGVAWSTDGGMTFPDTQKAWVLSATPDKINGAQVLVDQYSGYVYVLWTDFTTNPNHIYMSTSTNGGRNWSSPESVASGKMVFPNQQNGYGYLKGGIRSPSFSMTRFNWVANKICVVWHEWKASAPSNCNSLPAGSAGCNTDVYYNAKSPSGWLSTTGIKINDNQTSTDSFMPALDFDSAGNMTVTFYDRRRDSSNNILYDQYMARINSSGSPLQANARVSTFQSDPSKYTLYPGFIGDYQDIWEQTISNVDTFFSSWAGIPGHCSNSVTTSCTQSSNCPSGGTCIFIGDIYMSTIVP